jgi:hypothetical protein
LMKGGKALNERRLSLRIHEALSDHQHSETIYTLSQGSTPYC